MDGETLHQQRDPERGGCSRVCTTGQRATAQGEQDRSCKERDRCCPAGSPRPQGEDCQREEAGDEPGGGPSWIGEAQSDAENHGHGNCTDR